MVQVDVKDQAVSIERYATIVTFSGEMEKLARAIAIALARAGSYWDHFTHNSPCFIGSAGLVVLPTEKTALSLLYILSTVKGSTRVQLSTSSSGYSCGSLHSLPSHPCNHLL